MKWQDLLMVGNQMLGLGFLVDVCRSPEKPSLRYCLAGVWIPASNGLALLTLSLWGSAAGCAALACIWAVIARQQHHHRRRLMLDADAS